MVEYFVYFVYFVYSVYFVYFGMYVYRTMVECNVYRTMVECNVYRTMVEYCTSCVVRRSFQALFHITSSYHKHLFLSRCVHHHSSSVITIHHHLSPKNDDLAHNFGSFAAPSKRVDTLLFQVNMK